ncbi:hypothetical protein AAHA92_19326 [Salvia divinorum]|uniref:Reverse transcriptase n=1 Tax=Salvia divinorum TaxID=28513 RepID=A0ABD1H975_SALDI
MSSNPNDIPIPSREQFGLPRTDSIRQEQDIPTVTLATQSTNPTGHLDWIMSTIANLELRLSASERRATDHRVPPRPDPDPPYAVPLSAAFRDSPLLQQPLHTAVTDIHIPPHPFVTSPTQNINHSHGITAQYRHTNPSNFPPQPPLQYFPPPFFDSDSSGHSRLYPGQPPTGYHTLPHTGPIYTSLPGPRPTSCWYPSADRPPRGNQIPDQHRNVRIDPPRFDGNDTANWIFKIQYYFDHMMMPDANRLHYVVPLFDPPASEWIKHYCSNNDFMTWQEFLNEVRYRFDPDCYESYIGLIAKLCQTGTVSDYQLEFERLQNKLSGVPDYILLPIYVAGLKQPLQREVKLHHPTTLASAFALAKELSACRSDQPSSSSTYQRKPWVPRDSRTPYNSSSAMNTSTAQASQPHRTQASQPHRTQSARYRPIDLGKLPIVRLSGAEKSERSHRGLCWYCDDKWVPGHVCKQNFLAYMGGDEEDVDDQEQDSGLPEDNVITADLSHLSAIDVQQRAKSINMMGKIHTSTVNILVDTGSSHDFIHPRIAEKLSLSLTKIKPFRVYVGNGESLLCSHVSKDTVVDLQGHIFRINLHILAFHGPDIILGMDWLESLGRVTHDYVARTMEFVRDDSLIVLRGSSFIPHQISVHAFTALLSHRDQHELFEIVAVPQNSVREQSAQPLEFQDDLPSPIQRVLQDFAALFSPPENVPPSRQFDHRIHLLPDSKPVNVRPYRYPYFQKQEIEKQVGAMLEQGIIQPSQSPFSSPVLLVRKKDGSFCFCIDYRALNKATVPDHFPIPTADELFDELGAAKFFTKLDLRSGYHQIRMHREDIFKTAFRTHDGHFEFLVMPFGLTNAPSTFQAAMNSIFRPLLRKSVIVFFDDILIYSPTLDTHCSHLTEVLSTLADNQFFVKLSKCVFCSQSVDYLGHIITNGQLRADSSKLDAMVAWPTPSTVKQLRGFLGLTGYYRRFIAHYAMIAAPLTDLLKKDSFAWTSVAEDSFKALKAAMTSAPVLRLPDFTRTFYVETDASDFGIGAVLLQDGHPLAFFSKKLGPRRRSTSTYHKELYAIVEAVQKWRQYLLGREFIIRSDQKSLQDLLQQIIQTPDQQFYVRKLMGYKFRIEYKSGASNKVADALSRRDPVDETAGELFTAIAQPLPDLLADLRNETATSDALTAIRHSIADGSAPPHITYCDGLIYYNRRIYVDPNSPAKARLLFEHHNTPVAGHPGFDRTFRRLASAFFWPNMRREVRQYVASCVDCQTTKYSTQRPAGLLQPLPIPSQVWDDVSMDFITGLPPSRGYTVIMVAVDRLSKYAHFAPLPAKFDALRVARLFIDTVVKHHGFPKTLVSDRDPIFLSATWEHMLRLSGTKLHFTTAYHPQSDGQTEVRNRGLEQYLRAFTADKPSKWTNFLPWAELALNCFHHSALGTSPFHALYGREPPLLVAAPPSLSTPPAVADLIRQRGELLVKLRSNLECAQQRMRDVANRHRRDVHFEVGDMVLLKLQQYRQHSNGKAVEQGLVQWSDADQLSPSWEPISSLSTRFPSILLEDKDDSILGGVDTSHTPTQPSLHQERDHQTQLESNRDRDAQDTTKLQRTRRPPARFHDYVSL